MRRDFLEKILPAVRMRRRWELCPSYAEGAVAVHRLVRGLATRRALQLLEGGWGSCLLPFSGRLEQVPDPGEDACAFMSDGGERVGVEPLSSVRRQTGVRTLMLIPLVLAMPGCAAALSGTGVLADQKTGPSSLTDSVVSIAGDARTLETDWARHRLDGEPAAVNFDEQAVLLTSFGESSSCPYEHGGVDIDVDEGTLEFVDGARGRRVCTDDFVPRTLVVAVDLDQLPASPVRVTPPRADDPVPASLTVTRDQEDG